MSKAIIVRTSGGPEVLRYEEKSVPKPAAGQVLVRHMAIGLNFLDIYYRKGIYKAPSLPYVPGSEASGIVEEAGEGVSGFKSGDRVAYATQPFGAYADARVLPAAALVRLPDVIDFPAAAASLLKGMTARYLIRETFQVRKGDTVLFHSIAGGVGSIACQWLHHFGATVIGTIGDDAKAGFAKRNGCDHVVNYRRENFVDRVRAITGGHGVPVVYDSVGKDTFAGSLECLQPRGLLVSFGQSSGVVPPFDLLQLSSKGSLFLTRPTLNAYVSTPESLQENAAELFGMIASGAVRIPVNRVYPLAEAAQAHRDLEARKTTGSCVLIP